MRIQNKHLTKDQRKEISQVARDYDSWRTRGLKYRGIKRRRLFTRRPPKQHKSWPHFVTAYQKAVQNHIPFREWVRSQFVWYDHFLGKTPNPKNLHDRGSMGRYLFALGVVFSSKQKEETEIKVAQHLANRLQTTLKGAVQRFKDEGIFSKGFVTKVESGQFEA